ncbi:MAG: hypothetical protein MUO62_00930, partial [Anaerolineales bacterium]|nr:hypothetical protein [Anaerolineales bacterium]
AEAARLVTRRRRSQRLFQIVAAGAVIGALPWLLRSLLFGALLSALWQGVYLVTATSSAFYRMKGIFLKR